MRNVGHRSIVFTAVFILMAVGTVNFAGFKRVALIAEMPGTRKPNKAKKDG